MIVIVVIMIIVRVTVNMTVTMLSSKNSVNKKDQTVADEKKKVRERKNIVIIKFFNFFSCFFVYSSLFIVFLLHFVIVLFNRLWQDVNESHGKEYTSSEAIH